jgi:hypothetical protein
MRKRLTWTTGIAVAGIMAAAAAAYAVGPGPDGNVQDMTAKFTPKKLSKSKLQPVTLSVTTDLSSTTAANGVPVPATSTVIDFDKNAQLFTKGIPTCNVVNLANQTTDAAKAACPKSIVGSGAATVLIPVGTQVFTEPVTVTAFNGVPQGGKPVLLLHTYGATPVQVATDLTGTISNYNKQGFGPRLDVLIPPLAGGTGALTHFETTVNRTFNYKGKKRSYVSAKCPNSKKLKARGTFTFLDGQALTVPVSQKCSQKK